ncbi:MAG: hypothetical protein GY795_20980 [Desulfobacterales bacterium]|nr:hypothetical protein [Desulfobacterales bacterium]
MDNSSKKNCPNCKEEINSDIDECPLCGYNYLPKEQNPFVKFITEDIQHDKSIEDIEDIDERYISEPKESPEVLFENKQSDKETTTGEVDKLSEDDIEGIIKKCSEYRKQKYKFYGLFGFSGTGKSTFLYSLMQQFRSGRDGYSGYVCSGSQWNQLEGQIKAMWEKDIIRGTARGLYIYRAQKTLKGKKHILFLDIAGEQFSNIQDWSGRMGDFFGLYLPNCSGYLIFFNILRGFDLNRKLNINENLLSESDIQMDRIVSFLSVAATAAEKRRKKDQTQLKQAIENSVKHIGEKQLKVPVALCLSRADEVENHYFEKFGDTIPRNVNPWDVVKEYWPGHLKSLLSIAPKLKIEWLSSLGREFNYSKQKGNPKMGTPLGLRSVFDFVVANPPQSWAMPSKDYLWLRKWFGPLFPGRR